VTVSVGLEPRISLSTHARAGDLVNRSGTGNLAAIDPTIRPEIGATRSRPARLISAIQRIRQEAARLAVSDRIPRRMSGETAVAGRGDGRITNWIAGEVLGAKWLVGGSPRGAGG